MENEEYICWKNSTPYLYNLVVTSGLKWPSLTLEWLPDYNFVENSVSVHKLLIGTHTSPQTEGGPLEPNHLLIAEVKLPSSRTGFDISQYDEEMDAQALPSSVSVPAKVEIQKMINHPGEVNKARHMPQNPSVIATKTIYSDVLIFVEKEHPAKPIDDQIRPEMILSGHSAEGFGISWNPLAEGHLLSSSNDNNICYWDIGAGAFTGCQEAQLTFRGHKDVVSDVSWHPKKMAYFASVADDGNFLMWDIRKPTAVLPKRVHNDAVNSLSFSPYSEWIFLTGSSDKTIKVWDLRNIKIPVRTLKSHADKVNGVQWSPHEETIFASHSDDRRLNIWDLSATGKQLPHPKDTEDGPAELLFVHGGHTDIISDFGWCPDIPWLCASVSQDNVLQIWQPGEHIYTSNPIHI
uniref:Histone-binding protein RBBP4-like N-terminal domain-containing protein n=1 Tax=Arcella intermedia TaxID=1963864 RepID=A0A6B2L5N4_9EUKA